MQEGSGKDRLKLNSIWISRMEAVSILQLHPKCLSPVHSSNKTSSKLSDLLDSISTATKFHIGNLEENKRNGRKKIQLLYLIRKKNNAIGRYNISFQTKR